ncbi:capsule assembly Wzi family protein [Mucilaginibacter ginsenosidivorax]|uniref:Capsule assembly Wzi family protein n=1 Tax=Mucilaginibacter ginsenosidivorax TaxID=862126 RepID=A0A5B8W8T6_9SPHI|nr:capsule assembly Wzi family protein [Mucilaginibacter ginsenosidivorax]QEC80091.1 capsule assembly Wzi family protein [Mucilaginibacter ginsenosidivorax]
MQKIYPFLSIKSIFLAGAILVSVQGAKAQSTYLPNSYQLYQKFNADIYSTKTSFHSSLRPFLIDSLIQHSYDSVMNVGVNPDRKSWFTRKLLNEHLFEVKRPNYTFYGDVILDLDLSKDFNAKTGGLAQRYSAQGQLATLTVNSSNYLNTRGYQFGGTVGKNFSFFTSGFENSAKFPTYYNTVVNANQFIPGQAYLRNYQGIAKNSADWSYVTAILSYNVSKNVNVTLGEDKMFIGDGYRSLLLSDYAANMPLLRVTANLGKHVQYMAAWAYIEDLKETKFDTFGSNRRKWAFFHYIDWNVSNRVSFGFFNALISPEADATGNRRGFDANMINPIFFSSSLGPSQQPKDNTLVGFTAKYKILDKTALYAQLLLDRFKAGGFFSGNNADNTNGVQVGIRGADLFAVKHFNYLFEFNTVKPYTYQNANTISSYNFYGDPLAHPYGANFREALGILNYSFGRIDLQGQINYAKYGTDSLSTINNGKIVNKPFVPTAATTTTVGQGLSTQLYYAEGTISFLINPKYNLRFELSGLYRQEKSAKADNKTTMLTFGLRSSFRNLYHDF